MIENQIKDFRNYLVQLGYSKSSCYMLPECVKDFLEFHNATHTQEFNTDHIKEFYEWLQQRPHKRKPGGLSEVYINHHVYALRVFFNWLEDTGQINYNPISAMKFKTPKHHPRQPLTLQEIQVLFESATTKRETALLHLFYSCGLRRNEAVSLNSRDIHFKQQLLYVREGKGAKRRAVPLTARVSKELESYYLEERIQVMARDTEAFMLNKTGTRMSGNSYNRSLKAMLERTQITKEASLHHLRHSIASHLLERGLTVEYVRDFLGHAFLESTQIYTKVNQWQLNKL